MRKITTVLLLLAGVLLAGCQSSSPIQDLMSGRSIDYADADSQKEKALQYPPDLLSAGGSAAGTVSLSEYSIAAVPNVAEGEVVSSLGEVVDIAYRREGTMRWVQTDIPAEEAWQLARLFWQDHLSFPLVNEESRLGILETDWLKLRERLNAPGLTGYLDTLLNRMHDSGERDKFVTRLERNDNGGTDIYVSHRHIVARFDKDSKFSGYESLPADGQLEVEMLRRLMLFIVDQTSSEQKSADEEAVNKQVAAAEAAEAAYYEHQGTQLWIDKSFDESWQLVQIALGRGGFTIEDRDFGRGVVYIKHSGGPESDEIFGKAETSFFNRLFGEERPILREIALTIKDADGRVLVTAEAIKGEEALTEKQATVVLELLAKYML